MFALHHLAALEQLDWLRRGEVTPLELTEHYPRRIDVHNPTLGALTDGGLPMGAQLIGAQLERRLHWQQRHPDYW